MGGFQKALGRVYQPIRRVIDPLNIMDPMNILPGATLGGGRKPFTLDPNYGGALAKMFQGPKQSAYRPYDFSGMQQMMQQQSQNPAMMSVLQQNQKTTADSQARLAADLQAKNAAQQQNIRSQLAAADSGMQNFSSKPAISVEYSFLPKSSQYEKTQLANKFTPPKISDITFGGI